MSILKPKRQSNKKKRDEDRNDVIFTEKARKEAAKTMKKVKEAMKLDYFEE